MRDGLVQTPVLRPGRVVVTIGGGCADAVGLGDVMRDAAAENEQVAQE